MDIYKVPKLDLKGKSFDMTLPASKSIANRALILSAQSEGEFRVDGDLAADDIQIMITALKELGVKIEADENGAFFKNDLSWMNAEEEIELDLQNSGTSIRFLTSLVTLRKGSTVLTGKQRMKERPIGDLVDALRSLNVEIEYLEKDGYPPLKVKGIGEEIGKSVKVKGSTSSQFISSLMLIGCNVELEGELVSRPYVDLTGRMIDDWKPGEDYPVEGDASAAVYWWALAFLHNCRVNITNLPADTMQADAKFENVLAYLKLGDPCCDDGFDIFMGHMPDASLMLMALAPLLPLPIRISGLSTLRVKETDRIEAMATELKKVGLKLETGDDWMMIYPLENPDVQEVQIDTYDDHRIAMSIAILGTKLGHLQIKDPDCVAKTFPGFWDELDKLK